MVRLRIDGKTCAVFVFGCVCVENVRIRMGVNEIPKSLSDAISKHSFIGCVKDLQGGTSGRCSCSISLGIFLIRWRFWLCVGRSYWVGIALLLCYYCDIICCSESRDIYCKEDWPIQF